MTQPVVAISGGSKGLGYALAKGLLESGFAVSICARCEQSLAVAKGALGSLGPIYVHTADVTDSRAAAAWIEATVNEFGRLDALVHNASTVGDTPMPRLSETSLANLRQVFEVNLFAPVSITQSALGALAAQPQALVITISSDAAIGGYPTWGTYGSSKAALDLVSLTMSQELEDTGVTVYAIDPGDMDTDMHRAAAPSDTGLPYPTASANALVPLFDPILRHTPLPHPSGSRFTVVHENGSAQLAVSKREVVLTPAFADIPQSPMKGGE